MKNKEPPGITTLWDEGAGGFCMLGNYLWWQEMSTAGFMKDLQ